MSDVIEKIKKRIEARKWKITDDAFVPELIGMQYANNMNDWCLEIIDKESAKEPQECNSDLISRNKLIDDIETLRNQIHILTTNIRSLVPTKCDNVSAINEKCNNIMSEIDAFQTGYKQQHKYNSDLISRNMLIESFNASINTGYETFPFDIIVEVINNQPQVQPIVITQADRIRNMSDEELADIIFSSCIDRVNDLMCDDIKQADGNCHKCVLKWLKSEVKEV